MRDLPPAKKSKDSDGQKWRHDLEHPVTGERIIILETSEETDGKYATFELRVQPHIYPFAEEFFETFFGLAQDGKVNPMRGLPNIMWLAVILRSYRDFLYLAKPPLFVQRAIFTPLAAVAWLRGYRVPYPYPYAPAQRPGARNVREEVGM